MPYALAGPQIEPQAAHWTYDGYRVRVTDVHSDHPTGNVVPPYDTNPAILEYEIQELVDLAGKRTSAADITGTFNPVLINDSNNQPIQDVRPRSRYALSAFFRLRPPPITAQFNTANWQIQCDCDPANPDEDVFVRPVVDIFDQCNMGGPPIVTNGQELARMLEAETPGLMHRHALNCLLFVRPSVSPPRQARVWMALDLAIYSALVAAWHVKWGHRQGGTHVNDPQANQADYTRSYRERPIEYELRVAQQTSQPPRFEVLYDYELNPDGTERGPRRCPNAFVSPGTPRHPAYPSGHSTYSAAASHILEYFFSRDTLDLSDDEVFALPEAAQPGTGPWVAAELKVG